jgi:hypothetical protein
LLSVLPGSEQWDADRVASERVLAARISRMASGYLKEHTTWQGDACCSTLVLPLRYRAGEFVGRLIIKGTVFPNECTWIGLVGASIQMRPKHPGSTSGRKFDADTLREMLGARESGVDGRADALDFAKAEALLDDFAQFWTVEDAPAE